MQAFSLLTSCEFIFVKIANVVVNSLILLLTLYTLTSVNIFSILFSIQFLQCGQGEFVYQSRASLVGDHVLYSHKH